MIEVTCPHCGWTVFEGGAHVCVEKLKPVKVEKWKLTQPQSSDPTTQTEAIRENKWARTKIWIPGAPDEEA